MSVPRKPQPSSNAGPRRVLIVCVAALLLIGGWFWLEYAATPNPATPITPSANPAQTAPAGTTQPIVGEADSGVMRQPVSVNKPVPTKKPGATEPEPEPMNVAEPGPVAAEPVPKPVVEKPAPAKCDQLVMRNGDLVEVVVLEVGVNEIRYERCNWPDSPAYAVRKADVLSIHFGNGDTERF